jgi:hypothetical protein
MSDLEKVLDFIRCMSESYKAPQNEWEQGVKDACMDITSFVESLIYETDRC